MAKQLYIQKLIQLNNINESLIDLEKAYVKAVEENPDLNSKRIELLKNDYLTPIINKREEYSLILSKLLESSNAMLEKENSLKESKLSKRDYLLEELTKLNDSNNLIKKEEIYILDNHKLLDIKIIYLINPFIYYSY